MKTWPIIGAGIIALLISVAIYVFNPRFLSAISLQSYDTLMKYTAVQPQSGSVVIVDIDDDSLGAYGQWPWPRFLMARLADRMWDAGAAVVAYDIVFAEPDRASPSVMKRTWEQIYGKRINIEIATGEVGDFDERFAQSLVRGRSVLGCSMKLPDVILDENPIRPDEGYRGYYYEMGEPQRNFILQARGVVAPIVVLQNAAAGVAFDNITSDQDNIVRKVPLIASCGPGRIYPSLSMESLRYYLEVPRYGISYAEDGMVGVQEIRMEEMSIPTDPSGRLVVNFRNGRFPVVPALDVLNGTVSPDIFRDKIVLVGTSAAGLRDLKATPLQMEFPGVEVHATAIDNMLAGDMLREPSWTFTVNLAAMLLGG
ncbi:MAG: CHASE2 domain-containing protein, partial [Spartobacteria bacterium]|nr:CHASE2 domain-containing protein [Spartobacteria bacterium]